QHRCRILARGARSLLVQVIAVFPHALAKALVPPFHGRDEVFRSHLAALRLGQCIGACTTAVKTARKSERNRGTRRLEKISATRAAVAVPRVFKVVAHRFSPLPVSVSSPQNTAAHVAT